MRKEESWRKYSRKTDYVTLLFETLQSWQPGKVSRSSLVWDTDAFIIRLLLAHIYSLVSSCLPCCMKFCTVSPLHVLCPQPWIPFPNLFPGKLLILQDSAPGATSLTSSVGTDHNLFCDSPIFGRWSYFSIYHTKIHLSIIILDLCSKPGFAIWPLWTSASSAVYLSKW